MASIIFACTNCCDSHLHVLMSKQVHLLSYLIYYYKFLEDPKPQTNTLTSECSILFFKGSKFPSKIKFKFNKSLTT